MTINSNPKLEERFNKVGSNLKSIHDNGIQLVRDYRTDSRQDIQEAVAWIERISLYIAANIWTFNDQLIRQSPNATIIFFKNLAQYILSVSDIYRENIFLKTGVQSEYTYFKTLTDNIFNANDLNMAFTRIDDALISIHMWLKSLRESFRQGRAIKVEEMPK